MQFTRFDTKLPDGVYVSLEKQLEPDCISKPRDNDDDDLAMSESRNKDWLDDKWHYVGVRCVAHISVVSSGAGTAYQLLSAGCWGVESDSDDATIDEIYDDERSDMLAQIKLLRSLPITFVTEEAVASACEA